MKVLYNDAISKGTITFEENTLDDYDYYEFILCYLFFTSNN